MDLLFLILDIFIAVLFAGLRGEFDTDDKGKRRRKPILYTVEEDLEFVECPSCGKPNQLERPSCSACGALQGAARA